MACRARGQAVTEFSVRTDKNAEGGRRKKVQMGTAGGSDKRVDSKVRQFGYLLAWKAWEVIWTGQLTHLLSGSQASRASNTADS